MKKKIENEKKELEKRNSSVGNLAKTFGGASKGLKQGEELERRPTYKGDESVELDKNSYP